MKDRYTILDLAKRYGITKTGVRYKLNQLTDAQKAEYIIPADNKGKLYVTRNGVRHLDSIITIKPTPTPDATKQPSIVDTTAITQEVMNTANQTFARQNDVALIKHQSDTNKADIERIIRRQNIDVIVVIVFVIIAFVFGWCLKQ